MGNRFCYGRKVGRWLWLRWWIMTAREGPRCTAAPSCGNMVYDLEHKLDTRVFPRFFFFFFFKGILKLLFLPVIWKHHAKVIIFFKRNYFKGILNLFQRENVLRSQGLYNSNLLSIWSKKMCRPFLPLTITIINVSLYNFLFFVCLETPSWPSFSCVCVCAFCFFFTC